MNFEKAIFWIMVVLLILIIIDLIGGLLYLAFGLFRPIYHDFMGWHQPSNESASSFDGCSLHNICKYCGKEIMQDSQGNWF